LMDFSYSLRLSFGISLAINKLFAIFQSKINFPESVL